MCLILSVTLFLYHSFCNLIMSVASIFLRICVIQDYTLKKEIGQGIQENGVHNFSQAQAKPISIVFLNLLHKRLGHPSFYVLQQSLGFSGASKSYLKYCFVCFQAKQSRKSFPISDKILVLCLDQFIAMPRVHINKNLFVDLLSFLL